MVVTLFGDIRYRCSVGKSPISLRVDVELCDWLVTLTYLMAVA